MVFGHELVERFLTNSMEAVRFSCYFITSFLSCSFSCMLVVYKTHFCYRTGRILHRVTAGR